MATTAQRPARQGQTSQVLSSPVFNAVLAVAGLAVPFIAWALDRAFVKDLLLIAETVLVLGLSVRLIWLRRA